jgi:DNA-binding winged helix-turn-helix (wHTH) protein
MQTFASHRMVRVPLMPLYFLNPGQIVTREQLQTQVWPANTFVEFDQGLYSAMARLRDALGDSSGNPRFIETISRRGYRFIAPINKAAENLAIGQAERRPSHASGIRSRWLA